MWRDASGWLRFKSLIMCCLGIAFLSLVGLLRVYISSGDKGSTSKMGIVVLGSMQSKALRSMVDEASGYGSDS